MAVIDYKEIAKHIRLDSNEIKKSAAWTMNTLAYDSQKLITKNASSDMNIRGSAKKALGFRVDEATESSLESAVMTNRGWLHYHLEQGTRSVKDSRVKYKGGSYLLIPSQKGMFAFNRKGVLKKTYTKDNFAVRSGGTLFYFHRMDRANKVFLLGILTKSAKFQEDTKPDKAVNEVMEKKALRLFKYALNKK